MRTRTRIKGLTDAQLEEFLRQLKVWDGDPPFTDVLVDAAMHAAALKERNGGGTALVPGLAKQTNLAESLIRKWIHGAPIDGVVAEFMVNELHIFLTQQRIPPAARPD